MAIREQDFSTFRLSLVGYVIICAASSGFYQGRFWGGEAPPWFWAALALVGGIIVMLKDMGYYHKYKKLLLLLDLIFIIPILAIPLIPIRHDLSLILMLIYGVVFLLLYIFDYYKKSLRGRS